MIVTVNQDNVEELLVLLDQVQQLLVDLSQEHGDLRPEQVRWQSLMNRVFSKPGPIVRAADKVGGLNRLRVKHPPAEAVWWHLDRLTAERRRKSAIRALATILITVGVVGAVYWAVNTLFPPDPDAVLMVETTADVDQFVREEKWVQALAIVDRTLEQLPNEPELWIWRSVLLEQLDVVDSAAEAQEEARELLVDNPAQFWVALGNTRFRVGDIEGAEEAGHQAVAANPDDPQGYFLLGGVAEAKNDIGTAVEMFNRTYELAENTNMELAVIARVRLGQMLQRPQMPDASATPMSSDPSQSP
jgi:tetratricopeptide (TPR) repeat protein